MPLELRLSFFYKEDLPELAKIDKHLSHAKNVCKKNSDNVEAYIKAENKLDSLRIGAMILGTLFLITAISCYCITIFVSFPVLISVIALAGLFGISTIVLGCVGDKIEKSLKKLKELKQNYSQVPFFHYIECVKFGDPEFLKTLGKNNEDVKVPNLNGKIIRQVKVPNLNGKIINFIKRIFSQKSNAAPA
jgi:hypothetical protein